jgi:hypothetical protein
MGAKIDGKELEWTFLIHKKIFSTLNNKQLIVDDMGMIKGVVGIYTKDTMVACY